MSVSSTFPPARTDLSDEGLRAAIEADLVASRVFAPEVPVEIHDDPDATWGVASYPDPYRNMVVSAHFASEASRWLPGGRGEANTKAKRSPTANALESFLRRHE